MTPGGSSFFREIRRRRVVRVAVGYAAAAFVVLQAGEVVLEPLGADPAAMRWLVIGAIAGFPAAVLLGWLLDLTPEGIRLTRAAGAGPGRLLLRGRPVVVLASGAAAVLAAGAFLVGIRAAPPVPPRGTEMIAVLPFRVSGEGMSGLQDGMVELLSRNLDEVGGVRTADPRMVMRLWRSRGRDGDLSHEEAAALARETYATSFLSGSVVGTGSSVRITADLFSMDGVRLASARVDGPAERVLGLVDSLSVALLRDVWRTAQPVPRLDVAAVTSSDLGALRSFLEGERQYRVSAWAEALRAYEQAVAADSAFALAHYKRSVTAGWLGDDPRAGSAIEAALRHAHRLPEREQTLVRAQWLRQTGRAAQAVDTLSLYLERYPDDAEAWFFLADDLYHLRDERAEPVAPDPSATLYMFERALELDSAFVPSLLHPLEVAFAAGDTVRGARYIRMLSAAPRVDTGAVGVYRDGLEALAAPGRPEWAARALLRAAAAPAGGPTTLFHQAQRAVAEPLLARLAVQPPAARRGVVELLLASEHDRATAWGIQLLIAGGDLGPARAELERAARQRTLPRAALRQLATTAVLAGIADTAFFLPGAELSPTPGVRAGADALQAFDRRDPASFRAAMTALRAAVQDSALREAVPGLQRALERALRGDADGLVAAEAVLRDLGFAPGGLAEGFWFRVLAAQMAEPSLRGRAQSRLERPWRGDPAYEPRRLAALRTG